jgi:hypothetical protein
VSAKVSWLVSGPMPIDFTTGRERQCCKVQMCKEKKCYGFGPIY